MDSYKYDVFISYSRMDYVDDKNNIIPNNPLSAITDTLSQNGISCWIDIEGIYSGQEFENIIIDAIQSSMVFLFVSSSHSYESKWTKSEIFEAFDADKYIIPFKIDNCDYNNRLKFILRPLDFIQYCGNEQKALQELVRSINRYKADWAERQREKEDQQNHLKQKINDFATDYRIQEAKQDAIRKDIIELLKETGTKQKKCPVCDKTVSIDATYCDRCGWTFPALPTFNDDMSSLNQGLLSTIRTNWKCIHQYTKSKTLFDVLEKENKELKEKLEKVTEECTMFQETISSLQQNIQERIADKQNYSTSLLNSLNSIINATGLVTPSKSENIRAQEKKKSPLKLNYKIIKDKRDIFVNILLNCKSTHQMISDSSKAQVIDISKLLLLLDSKYGIRLNVQNFKYCNTVSDIINVISIEAKNTQ